MTFTEPLNIKSTKRNCDWYANIDEWYKEQAMRFYVLFTEMYGDPRVSRYICGAVNAIPSFGRMAQNLGTTLRVLFGLDPLEAHHKERNRLLVTRTANFGGKQGEDANLINTFRKIFNIMLYDRYCDMENSNCR